MDLSALESRVDQLTQEVKRLRHQVDHLTSSAAPPPPLPLIETHPTEEASEKVLSWVDHSALLPRISTVAFIMVVALILRTLTDKEIVSTPVGSVMGILYAGILLMMGAYSYFKHYAISPVFTTCGAILMFSIVVETHRRFDWLPETAAYPIVALVCAGGTFLSMRYRIKAPATVAILGASVASVAIELPDPTFPYLMAMLGLLNLVAYLVAGIRGCAWIRWIVLVMTVVMMAVWQAKLMGPVPISAKNLSLMVQGWFPFVIILFSIMNVGIALMGTLRGRTETVSLFNRMLPSINVVWAYAMLIRSAPLLAGSEIMFAIAGVFAGMGHFMVALVMSTKEARGRQASAAFFLAGVLLWILWGPALIGTVWVIPMISGVALIAAILAQRRNNGAVSVMTVLLQLYCVGTLMMVLVAMPAPPEGIAAALIVALTSWRQYVMRDRGAIVVLGVSLVSAFLMLRLAAYIILLGVWGDVTDVFNSTQSVIINGAAVALMAIAGWRRNKELRNVAIAVMIVGAARSLVADLISIHGVSLVVSIFSCGVAIAVNSVILSRWQKV